MASGVRARLGADVGVAVTGIAGPGGGTPEKPVGLVWIAVHASELKARRFHVGGDRAEIRQRAAQAALEMVRRALSND
jgi:nicotinamide-nucleotide amidase